MSRFQRGGPGFQKPESALKRAEELVAVGQKHAALQTLHDVITSKRHRTWQKVLEQILFKYVDLCVDLKKGRYAKDGLIHYRNVCQQVNVSSLEEVIKHFLKTATDKAEEAQSKAEAATLDVEDLEADASPEDLMMSYVSGEKGKDRTDRELVTPWFKFLWETYRTVLDILRNNSRLETLYAMTATKAFQFCLAYKRTTEFRRLCDILRNHLANLNKYRDQRDRPDLSNPESLALYIETRFEQLKVACDLALWQEAFRSVEDVQGLIALGKKSPKPQLMAVYYAKLTRIFTVSGSHLYNGYAWYKLFNLAKGYNKNLTQADLQAMASSVLLAALAILPYDHSSRALSEAEAEQERERSLRMAAILGFSLDARRDARSALSRTALVAELGAKGILNLVPEEIRAVYNALETEFNPLQLCAKLAPLLQKLEGQVIQLSGASPVAEADLGQYRRGLQQVAVLRMLAQLSQVYSVMTVDALAALVPFLSFGEVEQVIVDAVKYHHLQVRIDHRNNTVHFGKEKLESERIRDHITNVARRLAKALHLIAPEPPSTLLQQKQKAVADALATAETDNKRARARKLIIEQRKEAHERALMELEKEEELKRQQLARASELAEEERRRAERVKREEDRIAREAAEREEEQARQLLEQQKLKKGGKGLKLKEGEKLDAAELMREALREQMREREELEKKLAKQIKQMDYFERAKRQEEAPLLVAAYEAKLKEDEVYHAEQAAAFKIAHAKAWELDLAEKRRLAVMTDDRAAFQAKLEQRRAAEFAALQAARAKKLADLRASKRAERELARKREYVRRCREQLEEKRLREEEARAREEEEQRARAEAERVRKLEEAAARQRAREAEIEARLRAEKEAILKGTAAAPEPAAAEPAAAPRGGYVPPSKRGGYVPPSRRGDAAPAPAAAPAAAAAPAPTAPPAAEQRAVPSPVKAAPLEQEENRFQGRRADAPPAANEADDWRGRRSAAEAAAPPAAAPGRWRPSGARREEAPPAARAGEPDRWAPRGREGAPGGRGEDVPARGAAPPPTKPPSRW